MGTNCLKNIDAGENETRQTMNTVYYYWCNSKGARILANVIKSSTCGSANYDLLGLASFISRVLSH